MTSNMAKSQKMMIVEGDHVDRLSSLPNNVIECIMNSMRTRDAARTCVLSTRWRYAWADHPSLVLDKRFLHDIRHNRSPNELVLDYPKIVSSILLHHVGYIRTFVIHVPLAMSSMSHINMDSWLSSLRRKGLKELTINIICKNPYNLPCSVFSSSDLIKLDLSCCIIKSGCFTNVQTLILRKVVPNSSVLKTPLLDTLILDSCYGVDHFDISAPRLKFLFLHDKDEHNLKPFLICTSLHGVVLSSSKDSAYFEGRKSFSLVKLLVAWPRISTLAVTGFCFKNLATGSIPFIHDQLNLRSFSILDVKLDSELMPWILWILKNSPCLHTFKISFGVNDLNGGTTANIDESRYVLDFQMDRLDTIKMKGFTATPNELVFAKILLQCAPVLERMIVVENEALDAEVRLRILKNVLSLQQAYPKARIVFGPNRSQCQMWGRNFMFLDTKLYGFPA